MSHPEHARLVTRQGQPLLLEGIHIEGDVRGALFAARVEQRFRNPTVDHLEVVYTFPLPWQAVLLGVDVQLGDRCLSGLVMEKARAEQGYEQAVADGDAAIMLEKNHDHSYTLNLGNLGPGERCLIVLRYAQVLPFTQDGVRLLIPTVIAPRYGDAVADGGMQLHQAPVHDVTAAYPFDLALRLHGQFASARVASPSHPVSVAHTSIGGQNMLNVGLQRQGALDRDVVLLIDQLGEEGLAVVARDCVVPGAAVVLASFCPRLPASTAGVLAVKLLVDCSGSMNGDSIYAARQSLQAIVAQLQPGERFSLSRFGDTVAHRSRALWRTTDTTRVAARRWIDALQADLGGTEMAAALSSTFALSSADPADVLLLTDGEISAIDSTITLAKAAGQRVFIVAIGSSPAESHLRRLADATGGACDFVAPGEAVAPAVARMFARLRAPRLGDLRLVWPDAIVPAWTSPLPGAVFSGDTIHVFALLPAVPAGAARLMGTLSKGAPDHDLGVVMLDQEVTSGDDLARLAASLRAPDAPAQMAVAYQLVTEQTNFLLVHERAAEGKAPSMPRLHQVAQMVPAGWAGIGTARSNAWGMLKAPAMFRRGPSASASSGSYDIPQFLRRSHLDVADPFDAQNGQRDCDEHGLTPRGLGDWLQSTPSSEWPRRYVELIAIGVTGCVVEWLELAIAHGTPSEVDEWLVVHAFLLAVTELAGDAFGRRTMPAGMPADDAMDASGRLVASIRASLAGIDGDRWPDAVYALEGA